MSVGEKSVIFLLGAGCSCDANVPASKEMIQKLECLLEKTYADDLYPLYKYVMYTMQYGKNLAGKITDFNIESLLVTLHTLNDYKSAILYPFVMGYSQDLIEYAGESFKNIGRLIDVIEKELPRWVTLGSYTKASYYKGFERFQSELTYAIRLFSLNYDLCLEKNVTCVETGFLGDEPWDGNRFNKTDNEEETPIYLYKLHGSIDWERTNDQLKKSEQSGIKPDIIFGTDVKLQAIDPYLFYLYEFRKYAQSSEIIVIIGYSFNDSHINDLIRQAMETDKNKKIISVSPIQDIMEELKRILNRLKLENNATNQRRIIIENSKAKDFLENKLTLDYISQQLSQTELPF